LEGNVAFDIQANSSQPVMVVAWNLPPEDCSDIELSICSADGQVLASNVYHHPFKPMLRPGGYPWKFDPVLGVKVFDKPGASSLADQSSSPLIKWVPLGMREKIAEWALRQHFPPRFLSFVARVAAILDGTNETNANE
jgi:hypothetical protein